MITLIAGKYTGKTLEEVWEKDPKYLIFIVENITSPKYPIAHIKEFLSLRRSEYDEKENILKEKRKTLYKPIIDNIKGLMIKRGLNNKGTNFYFNMLTSLEEGKSLSSKAVEILSDSLAKAKGRRNSNIYKEYLDRFTKIFEEVNNLTV